MAETHRQAGELSDWRVSKVSSPQTPGIVNGTRSAVRPGAVPAPRPHDRRDPWLRIDPDGDMTFPLPGQPGHGRTAFLRRRPARIVAGRTGGGYTSSYELICPSCGDHPYLDFLEVPPRLQWLRGPWTLQAALAAYDEHLGLLSRPEENSTGSSGGDAKKSAPRAPRAEAASGYPQRDAASVIVTR